jgi:hypothetical protein
MSTTFRLNARQRLAFKSALSPHEKMTGHVAGRWSLNEKMRWLATLSDADEHFLSAARIRSALPLLRS